jgi:hypothetical protein
MNRVRVTTPLRAALLSAELQLHDLVRPFIAVESLVALHVIGGVTNRRGSRL